jgi:AcrR family transcriptional regulator
VPRLRFQRAPADKRDLLLDSATLEFAAHGYEDASINRILIAAGFSKGAFYYYFDDKADLAAAVLERWVKRHEDIWDGWGTPRTPDEFWATGKAFMERSTATLRQEPHATTDAMMRLASALAERQDVRERVLSSAVTGMMTTVVAIWKRGQEIGAVRTDLSVTALLTLLQEVKLSLVRLMLPRDRAATADEIESFSRVHFDLVRRIAERR